MLPTGPKLPITPQSQANSAQLTPAQILLIELHQRSNALNMQASIANVKANPELAVGIIREEAIKLTQENPYLHPSLKSDTLERIPKEPELANLIVQDFLNLTQPRINPCTLF